MPESTVKALSHKQTDVNTLNIKICAFEVLIINIIRVIYKEYNCYFNY